MENNRNIILISDAIGLVGAFIINELIAIVKENKDEWNVEIRAGYHTAAQLEIGVKTHAENSFVKPVLVAWEDFDSIRASMTGVNTLFLLTPFTSKLLECRKQWIDMALELGIQHILHTGIHHSELPDEELPRHELWNRQVEQYLQSLHKDRINYTLLRINFDGYNGVISPAGNISYFIPTNLNCGWIAREDIAAVAARVLLRPEQHNSKIYELSVEAISLNKMAIDASEVCNKTIVAVSKTPSDFLTLALSPMANPDNDQGYIEYMKSVADMFKGLLDTKEKGTYKHKLEIFPEVVQAVCNRQPITFKQWLAGSPHKNKLLQ